MTCSEELVQAGGKAAEGPVVRRGWQDPRHAEQGHATSLVGNVVLWDNPTRKRWQLHCEQEAHSVLTAQKQPCPGLHRQQRDQQVEGGDPAPLLGSHKTLFAALCAVLVCPA